VGPASAAAPLYSDAHFADGWTGSLSGADSQGRVEAIDSPHVAVVLRARALVIIGWRQDVHFADHTVARSEHYVLLLDCSKHAYQLSSSANSLRV